MSRFARQSNKYESSDESSSEASSGSVRAQTMRGAPSWTDELKKYSCMHKSYLKINGIQYAEIVGSLGSSIIVKLDAKFQTKNANPNYTSMTEYKLSKKTSISRDIREMSVKHACGRTGIFASQGNDAYLYMSETPFGVQPNNHYALTEEYMDTTDSHLRIVPVITIEELRADANEIMRLCKRVISEIEDNMAVSILETRERLDNAQQKFHGEFVKTTTDYFQLQDPTLNKLIKDIRDCKSELERNPADKNADKIRLDLQQREKALHILHHHMYEVRGIIEHLNNLSDIFSDNHEQLQELCDNMWKNK